MKKRAFLITVLVFSISTLYAQNVYVSDSTLRVKEKELLSKQKMEKQKKEEEKIKIMEEAFKNQMESNRIKDEDLQKNAEAYRKFQKKLREKEQEIRNEVFEKQGRSKLSNKVLLGEEISFAKESETKEYSFKIKKSKSSSILFFIYCAVEMGSVKIEIFDPKGKKQGNLSLIAASPHEKQDESSNGSLIKTVNEPEKGMWKIKITKSKATGKVKFGTTLMNAVI